MVVDGEWGEGLCLCSGMEKDQLVRAQSLQLEMAVQKLFPSLAKGQKSRESISKVEIF